MKGCPGGREDLWDTIDDVDDGIDVNVVVDEERKGV